METAMYAMQIKIDKANSREEIFAEEILAEEFSFCDFAPNRKSKIRNFFSIRNQSQNYILQFFIVPNRKNKHCGFFLIGSNREIKFRGKKSFFPRLRK